MNLQSHTFVSGPLDAPIKALPLGMGLAGAPEHVAEPNQPLVRMLEKRRLQCYLVMMLGDIAALALGFVIASIVRNFDPFGGEAMRQARMITPIFLTIALYNGSYSIAALGSLNTSLKRAAQALLLSAGIVLLIAFFMKTGGVYSRMTFGVGIVAAGLALCASRRLLSHFAILHCGGRVENVLIVEDGGPRVSIPGAYAISAAEQGLRPDIRDPLALDRLGRWFAPMDRVVISCAPRNRVAWSMTLKGLSVEGEIIDETVWELGALGARNAGGQGLLLVSHRPLDLRQRAVKRAFDLAIALPALVVLAPLLLVIAIAIRLQDGGPALFVQKRSGRGNRIFSIYKFRSMRIERQ
ncbi:MAG TPA: sugar transferase, partial [Croceicoccus sp.]|nr:sugar transferase [Croceicoccus sp.]